MIVAGFGFRASASADSLVEALAEALRTQAPNRKVTIIATARNKYDSAVFAALAQDLQLPSQGVDAGMLVAQKTITQSQASHDARGTGSVAEASALAVAGPGARLLGPRCVSRNRRATCALAVRGSE